MRQALSSAAAKGLDRLGMILSITCAVHCLAAPLILLFAPAIGEWWDHPWAHRLPAMAILPIAAIALGRGSLRHRNLGVIALGVIGVSLVSIGLFVQGAPVAEGCTPAATDVPACCLKPGAEGSNAIFLGLPLSGLLSVAGGLSLALAHLGNIRCCASGRCGPSS